MRPRKSLRLPPLTTRFLADRSRFLVGWILGLSCFSALILAIYPTIASSEEFTETLDAYPPEILEIFGEAGTFDLASPAGFLHAELFSLTFPLALTVMAIGLGATLGADRRSGHLDAVLVQPTTRRRVLLERAGSIVLCLAVVIGAVGVTVALLILLLSIDLNIWAIGAPLAGVFLIALFHAFASLLAAAYFGERGPAIGVSTILAALGYAADMVGRLVDGADWLHRVSAVSLGGKQSLIEGWSLGPAIVLICGCGLLVVGAIAVFENRDLH